MPDFFCSSPCFLVKPFLANFAFLLLLYFTVCHTVNNLFNIFECTHCNKIIFFCIHTLFNSIITKIFYTTKVKISKVKTKKFAKNVLNNVFVCVCLCVCVFVNNISIEILIFARDHSRFTIQTSIPFFISFIDILCPC